MPALSAASGDLLVYDATYHLASTSASSNLPPARSVLTNPHGSSALTAVAPPFVVKLDWCLLIAHVLSCIILTWLTVWLGCDAPSA